VREIAQDISRMVVRLNAEAVCTLLGENLRHLVEAARDVSVKA